VRRAERKAPRHVVFQVTSWLWHPKVLLIPLFSTTRSNNKLTCCVDAVKH
jgi:hypothetical protein